MPICPFANWVGPVPNRRPGGMVHPVKFVVEHVEAGTEQGSISWFQNPQAQVSAHFLIALDGTLHQAVDTDDVAWAESRFNPVAYSVETEGTPATALTDAQIVTFAKLIAWLHALDNFPLVVTDDPNESGGFITHSALGAAGGGHSSCPGPLRAAQRQQILDLAQGPVTKEQAMTLVIDPVGAVERPEHDGGWAFGARGHVYAYGQAQYLGGWDATTAGDSTRSCVALVATISGNGYWLISNHGECYAYGDATQTGNYQAAWGQGVIIGAYRNDKPGVTLVRDDGQALNTYALPA